MKYLIGILVIVVFFWECTGSMQEKAMEGKTADARESLVVANRYLVRTENEAIDRYVTRHGLEMQKTGSGLRYAILESGQGDIPALGDMVTLRYRLRSITGDLIYSSEESGDLSFTVGKDDVPTGLQEAIFLLHMGDKAVIILPSHLGYGLLGDQDKIPPRATLIYEAEIIGLRKKQAK